MGQKDLVSKQLLSYPDVFADIINAFVYEGEPVLCAEELRAAPTETLYRGERGIRNQFNDVSKYHVVAGDIQVQYTLENEVKAKRKTILRKVGYVGAVYREQYDRKEEYPFIALLLYWGKGKWKQPRSIYEIFGEKQLSGQVKRFMDNPKLHVYNMRSLPSKVRNRFKSDIRLVTDYLAGGRNYVPSHQQVVHVEAVLDMLYELTKDERYLDVAKVLLERKEEGEKITMCEILDSFIERGVQKGIAQGISQGISQGRTQGENLLAKLMEYLFRDNRIEDARLASTDEEMRKRFYREYQLV